MATTCNHHAQASRWLTRHCTPIAAALILCALAMGGLSACSASAAPDKTLTLGALLPTSDVEGAVGLAMRQAVDLAVKQHATLPDGYKLTVAHVDENSVDGATAATMFADNSEVVGVVGPLESETALAMLPIIEQAGLATITPAATLPGLTQADAASAEGLTFSQLHPQGAPVAFFRLPATDDALGKAAADVATAPTSANGLGAHAIFVVDDGTASGRAQVAAFRVELKAKGGSVAGQASLTPDNTQAIVSAIVDAYPDAVFVGGDLAAGAALRNALSLTGAPQMPLLTVGPSADDPGWGAAMSVTAAGANTTAILPAPALTTLPSASAVSAFTTAYQAAYHTAPTPLGALAYDAAMDEIAAISSVLTAGKSPTRAAVRAAVVASKFTGLIGPIAFDANGDNTTPPGFALYTCDTHGAWAYQTALKP